MVGNILVVSFALIACGRSPKPLPPAVPESPALPWLRQVGGTFPAQAQGEAVAIAPNGDTVVIFAVQGVVDIGDKTFRGAALITKGGLEGPHFALVRYGPAGAQLWASALEPDHCGVPDFAPMVRDR